ncbi:MAG: PEGA domain-containing protein [Candidatus Cloacimonetes bacterium]|jgi:hypothetical protein|nr:PEGA domain-containing protein [Candidatus Cloacimonadota bacterium]
MKRTKYFLTAFVLLFTALLSAQLKEFEVKESTAPAGIALVMDHPDCAQLVIHSQIVGLRFESNMAGIREQRHLPREDKYLVFITPVRQIITVKANGFIENQLGAAFELNAKERKYFVINERIGVVGSGKGSITLDSVPSGALIQIDGLPSFRERTPYRFRDYLAMNYALTLSLEGYDEVHYQLQILPDQEGNETLNLKANFAELVFTSTPKARVFINGKDKGETPLSFEGAQNGLKAGEYNISIERARYKRIEEKISLLAGDKEVKRYNLEPLFAEVVINSNPQGSAVYLNNSLLGRTPIELIGEDKALESGEYDLRVEPENSGFSILERRIKLEPGDVFSQTFEHSDQRRWLKISVKEQPVEAFLNGERNRLLEQGREILMTDERASLKVVFTGKDRDKYPPYNKELRLLGGEHHEEAVVFNAFRAHLDLRSDFHDVKLQVREKESGKRVFKGKSDSTIDLFPGTYTVSAKKSNFHNLNTEIVVNSEATQLFEFNPKFKSEKPKKAMTELLASSGTFAALSGATIFSWYLAEQNYTDYQAAVSVSEVERLRNATQKWDKAAQYLSVAEVAATAWLTRGVVNFIQIKKLEKEVKRIQRFDSRS